MKILPQNLANSTSTCFRNRLQSHHKRHITIESITNKAVIQYCWKPTVCPSNRPNQTSFNV